MSLYGIVQNPRNSSNFDWGFIWRFLARMFHFRCVWVKHGSGSPMQVDFLSVHRFLSKGGRNFYVMQYFSSLDMPCVFSRHITFTFIVYWQRQLKLFYCVHIMFKFMSHVRKTQALSQNLFCITNMQIFNFVKLLWRAGGQWTWPNIFV